MNLLRTSSVTLLVILAMLATPAGCDSTPNHFDRHMDSNGFSIAHPENWRSTTEGSTADVAVFRAISPAVAGRVGNANMNVISFSLEAGLELSTAPESARSIREDLYSDLQLIAEEWTTLGGERAFCCEYVGTANLSQGSIRLHMIWYYVINDARAYNLTLASPADRIDENRDDLEAIANSFRFES